MNEIIIAISLCAAAVGFLVGLVACHIEYKRRKQIEIEKAIKESYDHDELPIFLKRQAD